MCAMVKNRNGLTLTTPSPAAADLYQQGLDLVLSQNYGPEEKLRAAIDADDGFAMAHAVLAYIRHLQMDVPGARQAAEQAVQLSAGSNASAVRFPHSSRPAAKLSPSKSRSQTTGSAKCKPAEPTNADGCHGLCSPVAITPTAPAAAAARMAAPPLP